MGEDYLQLSPFKSEQLSMNFKRIKNRLKKTTLTSLIPKGEDEEF